MLSECTTYRHRIIIMCWGIILLSGFAAAAINATGNQLSAFLGADRPGKIVYNDSEYHIYLLDMTDSVLIERKMPGRTTGRSPLISPDGNFVTFKGPYGAYIWPLNPPDAEPVLVVPEAQEPHWWRSPVDSTGYLIYNTQNGRFYWPQPGSTVMQRFNPTTGTLYGEREILLENSFNGGLSYSGRYLCTAFETVDMYDLVDQVHFPMGVWGCNCSISPSTDGPDEARMMHLCRDMTIDGTDYRSHELFCIRNLAGVVLQYFYFPPSMDEWLDPEWSSDPAFCTVTGRSGSDLSLYIFNLESEKMMKVVSGDYHTPHLWLARNMRPFAKDGGYTGPDPTEFPDIRTTFRLDREGYLCRGNNRIFGVDAAVVYRPDGTLVKNVALLNNCVQIPDLTGELYIVRITMGWKCITGKLNNSLN